MCMKILIATLALVLAAAGPSAAQEADITGAWDLNVTTGQGPMPTSSLVLKKEGGKIVGTITGDLGVIPVEAEVKEKAVAIYGTVQMQQGPLDFVLSGTVDGAAMKGAVSYGGTVQGDWTAARTAAQPAPGAPPPAAQDKVDVTGVWNFEVTTEMGSGNNTMTFKQDGDKLTGQYSGQYGQAALTGTVKGQDINFTYSITGESTTVHVLYAGTVDKDTMKGTITIGEMGSGTFIGRKTK